MRSPANTLHVLWGQMAVIPILSETSWPLSHTHSNFVVLEQWFLSTLQPLWCLETQPLCCHPCWTSCGCEFSWLCMVMNMKDRETLIHTHRGISELGPHQIVWEMCLNVSALALCHCRVYSPQSPWFDLMLTHLLWRQRYICGQSSKGHNWEDFL